MSLTALALTLGLSTSGVVVLGLATLLTLFLLYSKLSSAKSRRTFLLTTAIGGTLVFSLVLPPTTSTTTSDPSPTKAGTPWQSAYGLQARAALPQYDNYVQNTDYYDYTDPAIDAVATQIAAESTSAKDAMARVLDYVYTHVAYVRNEPDAACFQGTAPQILASGLGQCDTQAIVVISLLRRMSIAATPVGGCVVSSGCILQTLFPIDAPKLMSVAPPQPGATTFSRGANGGLHAWVAAWDPEEGWLTLEETTGKFANTKCYTYHVELFPTNEQKRELCISTNFLYAAACSAGNIAAMNQYGPGVVGEVVPA